MADPGKEKRTKRKGTSSQPGGRERREWGGKRNQCIGGKSEGEKRGNVKKRKKSPHESCAKGGVKKRYVKT